MPERTLGEGEVLGGRYRVGRVIGKGGAGVVYAADDLRLSCPVAVKSVPHAPDGGEGENGPEGRALRQCRREAEVLVRLSHPRLRRVTDAFEEDGRFYLVMEYVEGATLAALLQEAGGRPLDPLRAIDWGLQIADVLGYLHAQDPPVIFRDLKPANVMVEPGGNVRLIDFGIARRFTPGAERDTTLLGSLGYCPPEQFGHSQTDERSDLYAFGATLFHLLTGHAPGSHPSGFPPARSLNPAVPPVLSEALTRCLSPDPADRPHDARAVAVALRLARELLTRPAARPAGPPPLPAPAAFGARRLAGGLAALTTLAAASLIAAFVSTSDAARTETFADAMPLTAAVTPARFAPSMPPGSLPMPRTAAVPGTILTAKPAPPAVTAARAGNPPPANAPARPLPLVLAYLPNPAASEPPAPAPPQAAREDIPTPASPAIPETSGEPQGQTPAASAALDLNAATREQLEALPGIGPELAARILDYRAGNGPFASPEELMLVSGIGSERFEGLRPLIAVAAQP